MTPADGRAGNICIWVITCIFFLSILSGSCLLILYIALPASAGTSWFPTFGMVLIGIPWAFWIFTCAYRCITSYLSPRRVDGTALRAAAVAPVTGLTADVESPVNSPGGARRVRFGNATLLGSQEGAGTRGGGQPGHDVDRGSPLAAGTTGSNSE